MKFRWFILIWSFAFLGVIALVGIAGMVDPATKDAIFKEGGGGGNTIRRGIFHGGGAPSVPNG